MTLTNEPTPETLHWIFARIRHRVEPNLAEQRLADAAFARANDL